MHLKRTDYNDNHNNEAEKYREQIEMNLMIHVLRVFDLIQLKKKSAYQVIFFLESPAKYIDIKIKTTKN